MKTLGSFGKDYFFIDENNSSVTNIVIPSEFKDCIYINGVVANRLPMHYESNAIDSSEGSFSSGTEFKNVKININGNIINNDNISVGDITSHIFYAQNSYSPVGNNYIDPESLDFYKSSDSSLFITDIVKIKDDVDAKIINLKELQYYGVSSNENIFGDKKIYHVHIDSSLPFTFALMSESALDIPSNYLICDYDPGKTDEETYGKYNKLIDNETSYELLRVNPKLTGNIKIVVDSSSNMYLDTFKVSNGLSQQRYRKVPLNENEYYGRQIMNVFSSLSSTDLYKIEDNCYNMFSIADNFGDQYYDLYNSGVRTNDDRIYSENYSILAPLYVNKNIPEFFLILKIKNYDDIKNNKDRIRYFLRNGEIVKVFDLRENSKIGKLIRNTYEHSKDFVGDLFVSYDYDKDNVYNGISIDRGVVAQMYESASLERNIKNQVSMNDWYTLGFERNRIVSKNILNFEFLFDDPEEELFSINTYFGIYVRLNGEDNDFHCIGVNSDGTPILDASISNNFFNESERQDGDLIYALATPDSLIRLRSGIFSNDDKEYVTSYDRKPETNIASPKIVKLKIPFDSASFVSMKVNAFLDPGEHYRIIDTDEKNIYDVTISNFPNKNMNISDVNVYYETINDSTYTTYRVSVYNIPYRNTSDDIAFKLTLKDEIELLSNAFNSFNQDKIKAYNNGKDTVSILYNKSFANGTTSLIFEKICSFAVITKDETYLEEEYSDYSTSFFGLENKEKILLDPLNDDLKIFYPTGLEATGHRFAYCVSFLPLTQPNEYVYCLVNKNVSEDISKESPVIYKSSNGYDLYEGFNIYTFDSSIIMQPQKVNAVNGFGSGDNYIMLLQTEPELINNRILFYNICPLNAGLCSIFPVKDFFTDVLDTKNSISTNQTDFITENSGEYTYSNNIYDKAIKTDCEENVMNYFDKYEEYTTYVDSSEGTVHINILNQTNLVPYLSELNYQNHKYSDISMLAPSCCKWKNMGTDAAGNRMRIMFDTQTELPNNSYFIPLDSSTHIGHVTVRKKDDDTNINYGKYINDHLETRIHTTFRNYMLNSEGSLDDVISDNDGIKAEMSKVYSYGDDAIEFISGGVKIRMTFFNDSIIKPNKYNGYSAMLICCAGNNPSGFNPCEIIIDEIAEKIAMIVYNGTTASQMIYNVMDKDNIYSKNTKSIPPVYPIYHTSSISDISTTYIGPQKSTIINDDGGFGEINAQLTKYNDTGYIILTSPVYNLESFVKDEFNVLYSTLINNNNDPENQKGKYYPSEYVPEYFVAVDSSYYKDSSYIEATTSNLQKKGSKLYDNIDAFIIRDGSTNYLRIPDSSTTVPETMDLNKLKTILSNPSIYVKTQSKTYNYTNLENLIQIEIIEPAKIQRENSAFKKDSSYGMVHPSYTEPVMCNIFEFENSIPQINNMFGKSFDGCNIRIKDVNNIDQIWIRKVSKKPLTENIEAKGTVNVKSILTNLNINEIVPLDSSINVGDILVDSSLLTYEVYNTNNLNTSIITSFNLNDSSIFNNPTGNMNVGDEISVYFNDSSANFVIYRIDNLDITKISDSSYKYKSGTIYVYDPNKNIPNNASYGKDPQNIYFTFDTVKYYNLCDGDFDVFSVNHREYAHSGIFTNTLNQSFNLNFVDYKDGYVQHTLDYETIISTIGFSILHDFNPLVNCWHSNMFRLFNGTDVYYDTDGITSGYEKNTFFASRGINLNGLDNGTVKKSVTITKWDKTTINGNNITLDVTDSLINLILNTQGFLSNWENINDNNSQNRSRYIKNSILRFINITDQCTFELYRRKASTMSFTSPKSLKGFEKVENFSNKLYMKHGKYYMNINNLEKYEYTAKLTIEL